MKTDTGTRKRIKLYYYLHWISDTLWSSLLDMEEEGNPDGETSQITRKKAFELKEKFKLKYIPNRDGY
jgi:hypothetical protein